MVYDTKKERPRGYAFIEFESESDMKSKWLNVLVNYSD